MRIQSVLLAATLALGTSPALAQERAVSVDLGLGAVSAPSYPGSNVQDSAPWLIFRNLKTGPAAEGGSGLSFGPSFALVGGRALEDDARLAGLDEIDRAVELGAKLRYDMGASHAYATLRRGFGGHEGMRGEVGLGASAGAETGTRYYGAIEAGFADDSFVQTYHGITEAEAAQSMYSAYAPSGGFYDVGVKLGARYPVGGLVDLIGEVEARRLVGDAADSPLTQDETQTTLRLGIVRNFSFRY